MLEFSTKVTCEPKKWVNPFVKNDAEKTKYLQAIKTQLLQLYSEYTNKNYVAVIAAILTLENRLKYLAFQDEKDCKQRYWKFR